jgi:3',5'-cyclic AMP phosphodiesterase CpdA
MLRKRFLFFALWLMVAGTILTPLQASGQTKIAVISDPHVISEELAENGAAWETTVSGSRKLLDYSKEVFDVLMAKFASEKPDILLISGDLTEDGGLKSHNYVAGELAKLEAGGVKVYVIPGNHDIGTALSESSFAEKYHAFGYEEGSEKDANSLSYACEPVPGLVLIGIDSHSGELTGGTLNWVCTQAEKAREAGKQVIAMMHHPLFPHISGAEMFVDSYAISDFETVRNRLADAGIRVILTGHFHVTDNAKDWNADKTAEIYDLNTGSTVSYPCDYRMLTLTLAGDNPSLRVKREKVTEVPSNADFQTLAENRLRASVENQAKSVISKKISSSTNPLAKLVSAEMQNKLAQLAGSVFIVHAEGDEDQSEEATNLKDKLGGLASVVSLLGFGDFNAMFNGVVENTSNYGTDRAFQCADDDLTISLPDLRESVTLAADGWASFSSARNLTLPEDGLKGYIVTAVSSTSATLQEVTQIPANTGVLLQGTGETTYHLENAEDVPVIQDANLLQPALEETSAPANAFVLASKNGTTGFYPVQQGVKIPAQKAYLVVSGTSARMLSISNNNATGITHLSEDTVPAAVYTLQGVRIAHPQKGVYIKNGKLYIAK